MPLHGWAGPLLLISGRLTWTCWCIKGVIIQTVFGLWCKATAQVAIWKINRNQAVCIWEKDQIGCKRIHQSKNIALFHLANWEVSNTINYCEIQGYFSFIYVKALNHKFDALSKLIEPGLLHPTTGEHCSTLKWKLQCFQEWYSVLQSHGWCIFYVQNQRGFLTFNFKSVYSAAVLRADKIS